MTENPRKELELSDVVFAVDVVIVDGVADEVEAGDAEALFIDSIVEERVSGISVGSLGDVSNADNGIMRVKRASFAELEREVARNNNGLFAVRKFIVEVATEVGIFVIYCCTHNLLVPLGAFAIIAMMLR